MNKLIFGAVLMLAACAGQPSVPAPPAANSALAFLSAIGHRSELGGRTVAPLKVIEDSRCPASVQCIRAGTVRLQVRLEYDGNSRVEVVGLNQPVSFEGKWLHLVEVCPARSSPERLADRDYHFTFAISDAADPPPSSVRCG